MKIAINGFGRIGRLVFQALVEQNLLGKDKLDVAAVVDLSTDAKYFAYQLKYDSVQGKMHADISTKGDDTLIINGHEIKCVSGKGLTPAQLPWKALGIDIVIESTGLYTNEKAYGHLEAGAKKVIISFVISYKILFAVISVLSSLILTLPVPSILNISFVSL